MNSELNYLDKGVSHPKQRTLSELLAAQQDLFEAQIEQIQLERGVSYRCALDICFLRTRARWQLSLEEKLIALHQNGEPPNVYHFGCK